MFNIKCEKIEKPKVTVKPCAMCGEYFKAEELNSKRLCKRCAEYRSRLADYHRAAV